MPASVSRLSFRAASTTFAPPPRPRASVTRMVTHHSLSTKALRRCLRRETSPIVFRIATAPWRTSGASSCRVSMRTGSVCGLLSCVRSVVACCRTVRSGSHNRRHKASKPRGTWRLVNPSRASWRTRIWGASRSRMRVSRRTGVSVCGVTAALMILVSPTTDRSSTASCCTSGEGSCKTSKRYDTVCGTFHWVRMALAWRRMLCSGSLSS